jgi:hypothetical protein
MPATAVHALPYPAPTDPADVPSDMQKLAAAVDTALLPTDTVVAGAVRVIRNLLAAGDANPAWQIRGDGRHDWGAGGASAMDSYLQRAGVNYLAMGGGCYFNVGLANQINIGTDGHLYLGQPNDTHIYRGAAGAVQTPGWFTSAAATPNYLPQLRTYILGYDGRSHFEGSYGASDSNGNASISWAFVYSSTNVFLSAMVANTLSPLTIVHNGVSQTGATIKIQDGFQTPFAVYFHYHVAGW